MTIDQKDWYWSGYPGHFCGAADCRFFLHTRVGGYRISTIGDYHPSAQEQQETIGTYRMFETMVFRVTEDGTPEGSCDLSSVDFAPYNDSRVAEAGHHAMCKKWAALQ